MTPLLAPASIRRCPAKSRSFLLGPEGPAGAPPGQRLRSGALIGLREKPAKNKIRLNEVSTLRGEPRRYNQTARPFNWKFTATDLARLLGRISAREHTARNPAELPEAA
jgi:hypothetical protein